MNSREFGFTYSASEPFTKNKEKIHKFKETGDSRYIYKNKLGKAFFMAVLLGRTVSDKAIRDKAFNIAKNPKYNGYQRGLALVVYKCFDKKSSTTYKGIGLILM